ncbi:chlorophyllase/cutinase-like alpha/beta fold protein [Methanobacterium oryzae]|uniref:alpha/beta hydrolase fold domain-containing protein n=1 Tax=Methanobacterium oryzae TaxID=69540 RepID=UPI003D24B2A6
MKIIPVLLIFCILNISVGWIILPKAPDAPLSGPGSLEYKHKGVIKSSYGEGANQYWIYEPDSPKPSSAPIIIFNHGWGAIYPEVYEAWIVHIVKRGNIVIYPRYQENIFTTSDKFTPNAINAVRNAINELKKNNHVQPELDKIAVVGHSAGGLISINMAANASDENIPIPKAVFCVEPGKHRTKEDPVGPPLENLSKIPQNTLLITLSGEQDNITGNADAIKIFSETTSVPPENKDYIILRSDNYGYPDLIADHIAPLAIIRTDNFSIFVDSLDYYGTWKLFDGLCDAAFYNTNRDYALGNSSKQRYMGVWSDGKPVNQMIIVDIS